MPPAKARRPFYRVLLQLPKWGVVAACLAAALLVGFLDLVTGHEVSMGIFYLGPVVMISWLLGSAAGFPFSIFCAALWLAAEKAGAHSYSHPAILYWNGLVRLGYFLIGVALATRLRLTLELEKTARDAAEDSSRLKSDMVSLVSHELGNGLALAIAAVFVLKESDPAAGDPTRAKFYDLLGRGHDNLKNVTSNFLNLARLESGKFKLEPKPTELRTIVRSTASLFETLIQEKRIRLDLDFPEHVIPINVDPHCMALVLNNLIGNALKYTPPEGHVAVRLAPKEVDGKPMVTVSVEDTGIGFSMAESDDILSGFHRTAEGKRMSAGFGVGLKVSQKMIEHHGSRLMVESSPEKGSRFYFDLPVCTDCPPLSPG